MLVDWRTGEKRKVRLIRPSTREPPQIKVLHFTPKHGTNCDPEEILYFPGTADEKK